MTGRTIPESELEDMRAIVRHAGLQEGDFEILEAEVGHDVSDVLPSTARVRIRHHPSNQTVSYASEPESGWLRRFGHDVAAGAFGQPLNT